MGNTKPVKKIGKKTGGRIRSMTGFGKGTVKSPYGRITAEIKTLNHKSLSISCSPFEGFFLLEERIKEIMENKILRGKVFIRLSRDLSGSKESIKKVQVNDDVAGDYLKKIKSMQKKLNLGGRINVEDLIAFPGVIEQANGGKEEKVWPYIKRAVEKAMESLIKYRQGEGQQLAKDFYKRLTRIKKIVQEVKKYEKKSIEEYKARLARMVKETTRETKIDNVRLEEEVALFARNCDIAEEVVRLGHHINAYNEALNTAKNDVGKKLDFIAQEMHREANTIGAKAADYRISNAVIEIKSEVEKIREQLKNIE